MHSDIAEAHDEGSMTALSMLDLSPAFEVIDDPIILKRLEVSFEKALTWGKAFIADRTQGVLIADKTSPDMGLHLGVPQISVFGPNNYCRYTKLAVEIIKLQLNIYLLNISYPPPRLCNN